MGDELEEQLEEQQRQRGPIFRDIRRYYCEYCGICRSKKSLLTSHILSHHQEEIEKKREEEVTEGSKSNKTCEECGANFKKPAHLKQHMLSHSFERSFVCPVNDCNANYRRKDHLNRHLLQHQGKLFKCPVENCSKEFAVQGNVSRHVKEFHVDKPEGESESEKSHNNNHVCQEVGCGKEFKYASQLQKHAESHVMESTETYCADPSCMKPFANVACLRAHIRSCHQHVKCEVCGSKHLRKNYKRHLQTHEERLPSLLKCNFEGCDHLFTTKSNMQQHVKAVHMELRPFACSFPGCGMSFAFKHVRDNHEKSGRHVYVHGNLEEFDEQFRSRPRGGRKRKLPDIVEMIGRKRITPPNQHDNVLNVSSEFLSWLLSDDEEF